MEIIIYILAVFMGLILGILGAGGAVLTIPILVYLAGFSALDAISSSLLVVCITSLAAGIHYYRSGNYNSRAIFLFGIPSILSVYITRAWVLPAIPDPVFSFEDNVFSKSNMLLILFALLVFFSSIRMISNRDTDNKPGHNSENFPRFIGMGLLVGSITGLLGAGGGFLIVPALVVLLQLDFKKAAGSSLFIISINTAGGILSNTDALKHLDLSFLFTFTAIAVMASLFGASFSSKIPSSKLKPAFGYFLILVAVFIIVKELFNP